MCSSRFELQLSKLATLARTCTRALPSGATTTLPSKSWVMPLTSCSLCVMVYLRVPSRTLKTAGAASSARAAIAVAKSPTSATARDREGILIILARIDCLEYEVIPAGIPPQPSTPGCWDQTKETGHGSQIDEDRGGVGALRVRGLRPRSETRAGRAARRARSERTRPPGRGGQRACVRQRRCSTSPDLLE